MSSNAACSYNWTYDVFLNFRGEDTRSGFAGFLYNALRQRGIQTFFDDEAIQRGEEISPSLFKAIKESRMAITVFSPNYASSAYCLDELTHILECIKEQGRLVWPVFYDVDPSQVRHQRGSYAEALYKHEEKHGKEKVQKWRLALFEAANLAGLEIKRGSGYEYVYIERIINDISAKINRIPLHVTDYPVGLEPRVLEVNLLLESGTDEGVNMVGICGIGGVGKTTIARAVYNLIGDKFEGLCFLSNVREMSNKYGIPYLQETLITKIVGEKDIKFGDVNEGISIIKHRLNQKKVLLVLDDVDEQQQLKAMAGSCDWFGCGSRIIITTRNKHLLAGHEVKRIYAVKELDDEEALELFSWNAFKQDKVNSIYCEVSKHVVRYSSGLPLALEVIGSNFLGKRIDEWISALDGYNKNLDTRIFYVLKLSYDTLEYTEKEIFLDVACFLKGYSLKYVNKMLQAVRDIKLEYAIGVLIEKSLIKISDYGHVTMHDLVQDMGKEIVQQESPKKPGDRSRLWFYKDILHVLQENTGTDKIEVLILDLLKSKEEVQWSEKAFKKMKNLKMLIIRNAQFTTAPSHLPNSLRVLEWSHYPGNALPFDFHPTNPFSLNLANSDYISLKSLITKNMKNLTIMDFSHCKFLTQVPNLSEVTNLEELHLDSCSSLAEIHDSVGFLSKLRVLSTEHCINLRTLPCGIKLTSLEVLKLSGCSSLQNFPEVLDKIEKITEICLEGTAIEELPYSIQNLTGLVRLCLWKCRHLKELPSSVLKLPKLFFISVDSCEEFRLFSKCEDEEGGVNLAKSSKVLLDFCHCKLSDECFSRCISWFPNMTCLDLSFNSITILPACMDECHYLTKLLVQNCKQLRRIEEMPPNLEFFRADNCISLTFPSSGVILNQAFRRPGRREFILPGHEVPKWFCHSNDGNSIQFWVRKEFPSLAVCVLISAFDVKNHIIDPLILNINGTVMKSYLNNMLFDPSRDHIYVFHLQSLYVEGKFQELLLPDQWNHIEVSRYKDGAAINSIAIHVCKQEDSMENIQFSKPISLKRSWHNVYNSNNYLVLGCHPLMKKRFMSLGLESNNCKEYIPLGTCWQEPPLSYVNEDSNSMTLASKRDFIDNEDGTDLYYPTMSQRENEVTRLSLGIQAPTVTAFSGKVTGESNQTTTSTMLLQRIIDGSSKNQIESTPNDVEMVKFCNDLTMIRAREEIQKAVETLQNLLCKDFSAILGQGQYCTMKTILDYLSNLSVVSGVSSEMRSIILELSKKFTYWTRDYEDSSKKIEMSTATLLKADKLEASLDGNWEVNGIENDLCNKLVYLGRIKKELEEQKNIIEDNIFIAQSAHELAGKRKREIYDVGKTLKAQKMS